MVNSSLTTFSWVLVGVGVVVCVFCMFLILRGKRVDHDHTGPQQVSFHGVELRLSSIGLLILASLAMVALPVVLQHYLPVVAGPPSDVVRSCSGKLDTITQQYQNEIRELRAAAVAERTASEAAYRDWRFTQAGIHESAAKQYDSRAEKLEEEGLKILRDVRDTIVSKCS